MVYNYLADEHGRSKNGNFLYLDDLRKIAREYRKNPTETERIFWQKVLRYDKCKYRFLRQKPINRFILDFYCPKLLLAIEIDGDSHRKKKYTDSERDNFLNKLNIITLRYSTHDVLINLTKITKDLKQKILEREKIVFSPPSVKGGCPPTADRGI